MDEALLNALDSDPEVKASGRSSAIREAVAAWLQRHRESAIEAAYRRGYGDRPGLGPDWEGWEQEGVWPPE